MSIINSPPPAELSIVKPHRRRVLSPEPRRTVVSKDLALARRLRGERSWSQHDTQENKVQG